MKLSLQLTSRRSSEKYPGIAVTTLLYSIEDNMLNVIAQ